MLPFEKIKRNTITRVKSEIAIKPEITTENLINYGIVNIDKPRGPTSHQISAFVKDILEIKEGNEWIEKSNEEIK